MMTSIMHKDLAVCLKCACGMDEGIFRRESNKPGSPEMQTCSAVDEEQAMICVYSLSMGLV